MPTADEMLGGVTGPGGPVTTGKPQTAEQMLGGVTGPGGAPKTTPPSAPPTASGGLLDWLDNNLWEPSKYVAGRVATGVLSPGQYAELEQEDLGGPASPKVSPGDIGPRTLESLTGGVGSLLGLPGMSVPREAPGTASRYVGAIGEAAGYSPLLTALAPEATVFGTAAGQGAYDLTGSPWASLGASLFAGAGATGIRTAIAQAFTNRALVAANAAAQARHEAASNALTIARDDLKDQNLTNKADIPAVQAKSATVRDAAIEKANQDLAAANATADANIENVANATGRSRTPQEAGEYTQSAARDWVTGKFPQEKAAAMEPVNEMVAAAPDMTVGRNNFGQTLAAITEKGGSNQALIDALRPTLPARLLKIFEPEGPAQLRPRQVSPTGAPMKPVPEPVAGTAQGWQDAAALRTAIGDAMSNPQIVRDIPAETLSRLYRAQTADMREALIEHSGSMSGDPVAAFDAANARLSELYSIAEGPMSRIVAGGRPSAADPRPEDVATRLLNEAKRGGTDLAILRREIPDAVDELAAAHLRQPGAWEGLSQEAKDALLPGVDRQHTIDVAMAGRQGAVENHQVATAAAKSDYRNTVDAAKAAGRQAVIDKTRTANQLTRDVREANKAAEAAKAALPEPAGAKWTLKDVQHSLLGPEIGSALGVLATHIIPNMGWETGGAAGILAGALAPYAARTVAGVARRPASLAASVLGGEAAGNALSIPGPAGPGP
jgi:hypothetical protein